MKLPSVRGFAPTSPTEAICAHLSDADRRKVPPPPPVDLANLFGIARVSDPFVRAQARTIETPRTAAFESAREDKKIPMSFSPPRFNAKGREEKWLLLLSTVTVTVTTDAARFTLTASNRGHTVLDSRDGKRRPLPMIRADLRRLMPDAAADAACAELASVIAPPRAAKGHRTREVSAEEKAAMNAARERWDAADAELAERRASRKRNPLTTDADRDKLTDEERDLSPEQFHARNLAMLAESNGWLAARIGKAPDGPDTAPALDCAPPFTDEEEDWRQYV